jgi:hypothetical protein
MDWASSSLFVATTEGKIVAINYCEAMLPTATFTSLLSRVCCCCWRLLHLSFGNSQRRPQRHVGESMQHLGVHHDGTAASGVLCRQLPVFWVIALHRVPCRLSSEHVIADVVVRRVRSQRWYTPVHERHVDWR